MEYHYHLVVYLLVPMMVACLDYNMGYLITLDKQIFELSCTHVHKFKQSLWLVPRVWVLGSSIWKPASLSPFIKCSLSCTKTVLVTSSQCTEYFLVTKETQVRTQLLDETSGFFPVNASS